MRWLYLLKLLGKLGTLWRISPTPVKMLLNAFLGRDTHTLRLPDGQLLPRQITPPNLYGYLLLQAHVSLAPEQPSETHMLRWELAPGRYFLTRLTTGMDLMTLYELFGRKDYGADFTNQVVLDVGAYNGDSAVYFALQGAKQVIALEPHPPSFALAQENIRQMGLEPRIILLPAALSTTDGEALLQVAPTEPDANSLTPPDSPLQKLISYTEKTPVQTLSLPTLRRQYGLEEIDFVKLDCEGCEFALIASLSEEELRRVKVWHIEYHARPEPLIQRLQGAGFLVEKKLDRGVLGYLIARRQVNNP